jgi:hypothetical protein
MNNYNFLFTFIVPHTLQKYMLDVYCDFFPKLKNYEIKLKKERTSEQCPEFVKKKSKKAYTMGQNCFNDIIQ